MTTGCTFSGNPGGPRSRGSLPHRSASLGNSRPPGAGPDTRRLTPRRPRRRLSPDGWAGRAAVPAVDQLRIGALTNREPPCGPGARRYDTPPGRSWSASGRRPLERILVCQRAVNEGICPIRSSADATRRRCGIDLPGRDAIRSVTGVTRIIHLSGRDIQVRANFPSGVAEQARTRWRAAVATSDPRPLGGGS